MAPKISKGDDDPNGIAVGKPRLNRSGNGDDGDLGSNILLRMSKEGDDGGDVGGGSGVSSSGGVSGSGGDGFGSSTEGVEEVDPEDRAIAFPGQRKRYTASAPPNNRQQPPRQPCRGGEEAMVFSNADSSGRNFYDPCEIAFRSRRLFEAYSGNESGGGGRSNLSPRRVESTRPPKVMLLSVYQCLTQTR